MPDLMIKLSRGLAMAVSRSADTSSEDLTRLIESYGATLGRPVGSAGEASQYFKVEGVEGESTERLRTELSRLEGVEAAYVKPADELP
jgi:hypothetical protein